MAVLKFVLLLFLFGAGFCGPCNLRTLKQYASVCVCNEEYCDDLVLLSNYSGAALYESNRDGARFESSVLQFSSTIPQGIPVYSTNSTQKFQNILGFGGAFTDSTGINIASLSTTLQKKLMNSYFTENGLQYNMGRVPMASCDLSTRIYSYDDSDTEDFSLKNFKLAEEDLLYKIPYIQAANRLSKDRILLFGSPWSAPAWMKTNGAMTGRGGLKGQPGDQYHQTWANYFVRFLQSYLEHNVSFWGVTMQNEPTAGCTSDTFQQMCFTPDHQRDFLKINLGPTLKNAGFGSDNLKIMILDDNRYNLPDWADVIMSDKEAAKYVSGLAIHWYGDSNNHKLIDVTHNRHPDIFYLPTEACNGLGIEPHVDLGNWERAENYAHDIIQDLLNWAAGWVDWNLALDLQGGPSWVKDFLDATIIVNPEAKEFYKQPMFYALAHFSKTLPRGSFRIGLNLSESSNTDPNLEIVAFQTPKDKTVVIVANRQDKDVQFALHDTSRGFLQVKIKAHAIQTYEW